MQAMELSGRVWFDFGNPAVWQFYRLVRVLAEDGTSVNLEWVPLFSGAQEDAMLTFLSLPSPQDRGRFLHAMFGLVHIEQLDPDDLLTVERALVACDLEPAERVSPDISPDILGEIAANAAALGVSKTPTLYDGGPVMHVVLNAAASLGDVEATAESITSVLRNDGIWSLGKP